MRVSITGVAGEGSASEMPLTGAEVRATLVLLATKLTARPAPSSSSATKVSGGANTGGGER